MLYQILLHLGLVGLVPLLVVWCFVFFKLNLVRLVSLFESKFSEFLQWILGVTDTEEELDDTVTLRFKWMSTSQRTSFGLKYMKSWIIWMGFFSFDITENTFCWKCCSSLTFSKLVWFVHLPLDFSASHWHLIPKNLKLRTMTFLRFLIFAMFPDVKSN